MNIEERAYILLLEFSFQSVRPSPFLTCIIDTCFIRIGIQHTYMNRHNGYMHCGYIHHGYMHCGYMHCGYMHRGYIHCGYMHHVYIHQILKIHQTSPLFSAQVTFFDGEIISEKHPFLTRKWDADEDVDKKHWVTFSSSSQPFSISEHFPTRGCVNVKLYFHWLDKTFQKHTLDFF